MLRLLLGQKGYVLVGNAQQQPSIQEAYHHQPLARAQRQLRLHNQRALGQRARARQKIELAEAPYKPDNQPQQGHKKKKYAHGLGIAAPRKRASAKAGPVRCRAAGRIARQAAFQTVAQTFGKMSRCLSSRAKALPRQLDSMPNDLIQPAGQA